MSNQLVLLYHIYNTYEVDKIYAPNFEYEEYFNIEKLVLCETCNCEVSLQGLSQHNKTKKHLKNSGGVMI